MSIRFSVTEHLSAVEDDIRSFWKPMVENLPDGLAVFDLADECLYMNPAGFRILGFDITCDGVAPQAAAEVSGLSGALVREGSQQVFDSELLGEKRLRITHERNARAVTLACQGWMSDECAALGSVRCLRFRDITQTDDKHSEQGEMLREIEAVITSIPEGVVVHAPDGRIKKINPAAMRLLGYTSSLLSEPLDKRLARVNGLCSSGGPIPYKLMPSARVLSGETFENMPAKIYGTSGEIDLLINGAPMFSCDGRLMGAVLTLFDVTEQRRHEKQRAFLLKHLKASFEASEQMRSEWAALFESIGDGIIVGGKKRNIIEANPAALRLAGVETTEELKELYAESAGGFTLFDEKGLMIPPRRNPMGPYYAR